MEFMSKFKPQELCLKEFKHWIVVLWETQLTLGDSVFILKRNIPSIGMAKEEEFAELPSVTAWYENKCKTLFAPVKFNYVSLMLRNLFVHYHAFPRYDAAREYAGKTWVDPNCLKPLPLRDDVAPAEVLNSLVRDMRDK